MGLKSGIVNSTNEYTHTHTKKTILIDIDSLVESPYMCIHILTISSQEI